MNDAPERLPNAPLVDLNAIEGAFEWADGFHRPEWDTIRREIEMLSREEWHDAWRDAGRQWMARLVSDLGGAYCVYESANFFLLTEQPTDRAREFLTFCEEAQFRIEQALGKAAMRGFYGKDVVLLFTECDDYYEYIAHWYGDGTHAQSSGVSLTSGGYIHIAIPHDARIDQQQPGAPSAASMAQRGTRDGDGKRSRRRTTRQRIRRANGAPRDLER